MVKMKNLMKYCITMLLCVTLLGISYPMTAFAAGEPSNGSYKIKCVGTGQYLSVVDGEVVLDSSNGTVFKIEDTEPSPSVIWFAISHQDRALSFDDTNGNSFLPFLISGSVDYGEFNYDAYMMQRFEFGKTRSGYNIYCIAFLDNGDKMVMTAENGKVCMKKGNGSLNQVFVLEQQ